MWCPLETGTEKTANQKQQPKMKASRIATESTARSNGDWQGMNWIRQSKRLAIYLRDNLSCLWCGHGIEQGAQLSLDHLRPHSKGGSNHESNLVTCCKHCNDSRGNRPALVFAKAVAEYADHGLTPETILWRIAKHAKLSLRAHSVTAKAMIEDRGSVAKALAGKGAQQ